MYGIAHPKLTKDKAKRGRSTMGKYSISLEVNPDEVHIIKYGTQKTKARAMEKLIEIQKEKGGLMYLTYKSKV